MLILVTLSADRLHDLCDDCDPRLNWGSRGSLANADSLQRSSTIGEFMLTGRPAPNRLQFSPVVISKVLETGIFWIR